MLQESVPELGVLQPLVTREGHSYESPGIVMVNPDGTFARMGVRPGDMPFAFHGDGNRCDVPRAHAR